MTNVTRGSFRLGTRTIVMQEKPIDAFMPLVPEEFYSARANRTGGKSLGLPSGDSLESGNKNSRGHCQPLCYPYVSASGEVELRKGLRHSILKCPH